MEHRGFRGGHPYARRTYYRNGRYYGRGYRGYYWHGHAYYGGYPGYWYGGGYYGWAYNPWPGPVAYGWGWGGAPWFGFYGAYFAPYPVYPSAAFWLTDYLIAANLQAAYAAQIAAANAAAGAAAAEAGAAAADADASAGQAPAAGGAVALSPEVKQAIAEEVRAQIAAEQAAAATAPTAAAASAQQPVTETAQDSGGGAPAAAPADEQIPAALDPQHTIFVVADDLNESTPDGEECSLTSGDVITRIDDSPDKDNKVTVRVTSSKKADCASGAKVAVDVDDLQEMHNHFQEQIDDGLKELADKQGKNGLPASPNPQARENPEGKADPDKDAQAQLQAVDQSADQTEAEVQQAAESAGQGDD
ncbi:MAG: hypothetical protein WB780_09920 [Candidatus Acidiferrales bacterium]